MDKPEFYAIYWLSTDGAAVVNIVESLAVAEQFAASLKPVQERKPSGDLQIGSSNECLGTPRIAKFEGSWIT